MPILATRYPVYQPAMRIISSITNTNPAVVTTTFNHQYETGLIVRINIMPGYGMSELNQQYGPIIVLSDTTFSIDINTTNMSAFSSPASFPQNYQYCTVVPIGAVNELYRLATVNVLPYQGV